MQKKLIALAVAGLASSAVLAQSNVTVYGVADVGYEHASGNGVKTSGINSGVRDGSRIGFKGEEALGNGMKAVFLLEYGLTTDVNSGIGAGNSSRQSYVGLSSNSGTVMAGRLYSPGKNFSDKFDAMDTSDFSPLQPLLNAAAASISNAGTLNNAIAYVSPTINGLTFTGEYSFAGAAATGDTTAFGVAPKKQERVAGFSVDYDMGPLALSFAHQRMDDIGNLSNLDKRENAIGGSYNFGPVALLATYQMVKSEFVGIVATKATAYSVGATVPVGTAGLVRIQYANLNDKMALNQDATSWGLGYDHNLSKRTMAYVGYNHVSNDNGAGISTAVGGGAVGGALGNSSNNGYGFGVKHTF